MTGSLVGLGDVPILSLWAHRNLLGLIHAGLNSGEPKAVTPEDAVDPTEIYGSVAVIPVVGPLWSSPWFGRLFCYYWRPSTAHLEAAVRKAAANDQVETIFLYVRSWGGDFAGLLDFADAVFEARRVKSVVAFIEDFGCSAAYLAAAQAEKIVINRGAQVGGLGVFSVLLDTAAEDERYGIKVIVVSSGGLKGEGARSEVSEALIADTQRLVADEARLFYETVRRGRGWSAETLRPLMDGRTHVGQMAVDLGLADGISTLHDYWSGLRSANRSLLLTGKETGMSRVADLEASRTLPAAECPPPAQGSGESLSAAATPPTPAPAVPEAPPELNAGSPPAAATRELDDEFEARLADERRATAVRVARTSVASRLEPMAVAPAVRAAGLEAVLVELTAQELYAGPCAVTRPDGTSGSVVETVYRCLAALPGVAAMTTGELAGDDAVAARRRPAGGGDADLLADGGSPLSSERLAELQHRYRYLDELAGDDDEEVV